MSKRKPDESPAAAVADHFFLAGYNRALDDVAVALSLPRRAEFLQKLRDRASRVMAKDVIDAAADGKKKGSK